MRIFDNRELALVGWIVVLLVWGFAARQTRPALARVVKAIFAPRLLLTLLMPLLLYALGEVYLLRLCRLWTPDLISETIFWFCGPAAILFSRFDKAGGDRRFFRKSVLDALRVAIVLEFLLNLFPFGLPVEVLLVPFLALLGGVLAVSSTKAEFAPAKRFVNGLLGFLGLVLLAYAVARVIQDPGFASVQNLREFVVPSLLTIGLLPFVYAVAVMTTYQMLFLRLRWKLDDSPSLGYARLRAFRYGLFSLRRLHRMSTQFPALVVASSSRAAIDRAARQAQRLGPASPT